MTANKRGIDSKQAKELRERAGRWLKTCRLAAGLTQKELADKVGLDYYTFVSQIEGGYGRVPSALFPAWAKAVNLESAVFARKMLEFYDPHIFRALGFEASEPGSETTVEVTSESVADLALEE